jgi:[ribosomal protein S18]-alanine N-acetyltransferase
MPEILFRELGETDVKTLAVFFEGNNLPAVVRNFNPFPLSSNTAQTLLAATHLDRFYGAFDGDRMAAFAMLRGWDEGYQVPSFGLLVDRDRQGRGIGRRMLEWTIAQAFALGCERIRLSVYASNLAAIHLYTAAGFAEIRREPVRVDGGADQTIVMFKDLA